MKKLSINDNKIEEKDPCSTLRITEESDIEFEIQTIQKDFNNDKNIVKNYKEQNEFIENINKSQRLSVIPNDDRYNEIYTRYY